MKKEIQKHIDKRHYVKIYLEEDDGSAMENFHGFIFEQTEKFVLMCQTNDLNFDDFVVLRKRDIAKIRRVKFEKFIDKVLQKEGLKEEMFDKHQNLDFELGSWKEMLEKLQQTDKPVIIEMNYGKYELFQLGAINSVKDKSVVLDYIAANGKYNHKPVTVKFKKITFLRFDGNYVNLFYKYAKRLK